MTDNPNARHTAQKGDTKTTTIKKIGDHLKVEYTAKRSDDKGWLEFSPKYLHIELNGQPLTTCEELKIVIKDGWPTATISLNLESIEIDADTMTRLQAFVGNKEYKNPNEEEDDE